MFCFVIPKDMFCKLKTNGKTYYSDEKVFSVLKFLNENVDEFEGG